MPYHVRVTTDTGPRDEVRLDVSEGDLERRFLQPYREGRPIVVGGRTVAPGSLERIRISYTVEPSDYWAPIVRQEEEAAAREGMVTFASEDWLIADKGQDVTERFITGPPGEGVTQTGASVPAQSATERTIPDAAAVFVVHGRNWKARDAMFSFLRALRAHPLEWEEARVATGRPSPYIGEILDAAFARAAAVLVLMTPDDLAYLQPQHQDEGDPPHETSATGQARPNVIFEAGMAMGRDENRTVLVELGKLRPFSDVGGRHVLRLNDTTQRRQELAQRLQSAGVAVDLTGTDWHRAGEFDASIAEG